MNEPSWADVAAGLNEVEADFLYAQALVDDESECAGALAARAQVETARRQLRHAKELIAAYYPEEGNDAR